MASRVKSKSGKAARDAASPARSNTRASQRAQDKARGRPKDPAKRDSMLAAAWILFARDGFERASMEQIAHEAGVSKATLYSHFDSKEALFEGMVRARIESHPVVVPPDLSDLADFRRTLESYGHRLMSILTSPQVHIMHRLLITHRERHPELLAIVHRNGPQRMHDEVAALLRRGHEAGHVHVPDAMAAADHLVSMWKGMAHVAMEMGIAGPRTPAQAKRHVRACTEILMRAYARRASAGSADAGVRER